MFVLLLLLLSLRTAAVDADLGARFELAQVPGITFVQAEGDRLAPDHFKPEPRYGINWASAPDVVIPVRYDPSGARVLLQSRGGVPLLVGRGRQVVVAFDTQGSVRRWLYFNYLLYCAASDQAGVPADSYEAWPHSPLPHARARTLFILGGIALWVAWLTAFRARPAPGT